MVILEDYLKVFKVNQNKVLQDRIHWNKIYKIKIIFKESAKIFNLYQNTQNY